MKTAKYLWIFIAVIALLFSDCGSGTERTYESTTTSTTTTIPQADSDCKCTSTPLNETNGLALTFEAQNVKKPANVSLLFKAATTAGIALPNLTASDFKLYEDDSFISAFESRQTIHPKPGVFKSHILLLLDLSGSILRSESLPVLKDAAKNFVLTLMQDSKTSTASEIDMGIWWFDGSAALFPLVEQFAADTNTLIAGIDTINLNMSKDNSTNLYGAVIEGITKIKGLTSTTQDSVNLGSIVIFTDGRDQAARRTKDEAMDAIKNAGQIVSVYTIGLGGEIDENVLKSFGKDGFALAANLNELIPKFQEVGGRIKNDVNSHYLLEYCSPKRKGSHNLKILLNYHELSGSLTTCFCASGFEGGCTLSP